MAAGRAGRRGVRCRRRGGARGSPPARLAITAEILPARRPAGGGRPALPGVRSPEAWVGRETAAFASAALAARARSRPTSIQLAHDGRLIDLQLITIADRGRRVPAHRGGAAGPRRLRRCRPESPRPSCACRRPPVWGAPEVGALGPAAAQRGDQPAHQPLVAAHASGHGRAEIAVWRSAWRPTATSSAHHLRQSDPHRASSSRDLYPRPDLALRPRQRRRSSTCSAGTLASVTDLDAVRWRPTPSRSKARPESGRFVQAIASRAARARALPAHPAAPRAARHGMAPWAIRRLPGRGWSRSTPALAALPIGEAELGLPCDLAHRTGDCRPVERRELRRGELHARGRRPAAVLGRPCRAALAQAAREPGDLT